MPNHFNANPSLPKISVIMPAYNAGRYIGQSIESVLGQTIDDWELLVIDDGSTDRTRNVVREFPDPRIRLFLRRHEGLISKVRNFGLSQAQGRYVAFLDSDDLYEPDALETLAAHLDARPDCNAVYGYFRWIDEDNHFVNVNNEIWLAKGADGRLHLPEERLHRWENILGGKTPTWLQSLMFRRSLLERIPAFSEQVLINEDYLFFLELFLHEFEAVHALPRYVFRYRNYPASITKTSQRFRQILDNYEAFFEHVLGDERLSPHFRHFSRERFVTRILFSSAITQLRFDKPDNARAACRAARRNPHVTRPLWLRYFLHILILSYLPYPLQRVVAEGLKHARRKAAAIRGFLSGDLPQPRPAPAS
jgi:glycosyltransferase involved in cell wall biosynthesis